MKAQIMIDFGDQKAAMQVMEAVSPDNLRLPSGLEIESHLEGSLLRFVVFCERGIDSLRATLEDLMSAVDVSMRTLDSVPISPQGDR